MHDLDMHATMARHVDGLLVTPLVVKGPRLQHGVFGRRRDSGEGLFWRITHAFLRAVVLVLLGVVAGANIGENGAVFEAVHGSAPDIAGQNKANPLATILSVAMMFKYTFNRADLSDRIGRAVKQVLREGKRTGDIAQPGEKVIGTKEMGDAVVAALKR